MCKLLAVKFGRLHPEPSTHINEMGSGAWLWSQGQEMETGEAAVGQLPSSGLRRRPCLKKYGGRDRGRPLILTFGFCALAWVYTPFP